jgi:Acetyltransferase (GNAT) domain
MPQKIEMIQPLDYPGWEDLVLTASNYSFFHSSNWARVLHESYGYTPVYWAAINDGRISAVIPCMEVNSILTGKRGVSLPFTDHCEPLLFERPASNELIPSLAARLIEYGKEASWSSIELRFGSAPCREPIPSSYVCYGHTVGLSENDDEMFAALRNSTRRNIKKATHAGVETRISHSMSDLKEFYHLNCLTRKDHGLPPQPLRFFEKVHEHILSKGKGIVALAKHEGACIAGAVYFHLGDQVIYKYGASNRTYQHLRANNIVMWEAIRWYARNGFRGLNLGRTEKENEGLLQFKRGWNVKERMINYYKYDLKKNTFVGERAGIFGGGRKIFRRVPVPLLRMTGSVLYKHIG